MPLPANTLLHTFNIYNAVVFTKDGRMIQWNTITGFSDPDGSAMGLPEVEISDYPDIIQAVEEWSKANPRQSVNIYLPRIGFRPMYLSGE